MKHSVKRLAALLLAAAMVFSLLPVSALAAPRRSSRTGGVTIDVTDYGADPTGAQESSTAVIKALAYAATLGDEVEKTISFPEGEYHFYADKSVEKELYVSNTVGTNQNYKNKRLGILVEGMKNVTVDGGGSQFIFHGDMTSFAAIDSQNVTFTNFSMDWASPSVIDVMVESRVEGENAVIVYIPPCYTYEINGTNIHWTVEGDSTHSGNNELNNGMKQIHDLSDGTTVRDSDRHVFSNVSSFEKLADNRLKITYSNANSVPAAGLCFQLRNTTRTTPGIFFWQSENITVSNTHVQFLHGFGMVAQLCKDITLNGVKFAPRAGTGRTTAGFADFVQMSSVGGKVTITNCEFSGPHDDPINIHGTFLVVKEISSDRRTVTVEYQHHETAGFPQYYVGDTVDFSTKGTIIPIDNSTRKVTAVENFPNGNRTRIKVTLDEAIPSEIAVDGHVLENVTYIPEVQIDHCRFVSTPTSGILVTTRKPVVIADNFFDRMGMQSIYISCDAQSWYESGRAEDVTIRNNTFIVNPRYAGDRGDLTAIGIRPTNNTHDANRQIHRNIKIENNTFLMAANVYAVNAKSVNTLTVKNNKFLRYTPNVELTLAASSTALAVGGTQASTLSTSGSSYSSRLFRLEACKNVTFENNTYDDGLNQGVSLSSITTTADVTATGDDLNVGGDKQLPAVGVVRYYSSDPAVATVSESGVVTGVGPGTAEIYAYRTVAGRTFESNRLTFTVSGEAVTPPSKIEIGGGADAVDVNVASPAFTAAVTGSTGNVIWAVKSVTDGAAATIDQSGALTATAPGVVEVTASLGGVTASKLVTVKTPTGGLNDVWTVDREVVGSWTLNAESNTVTITPQNGGDWGSGDSGGHDFFLTASPEGDFEITVRLDDYTCRQSNCWCEAGLVAFVDRNNYVSMTRKNANGSGALALSKEVGGSPDEHSRADVNQEQIYLKLARSGNTYTGAFSTDGNTWTSVGSYDASLNNARIGFYACNAGNPHNSATYTVDMGDFKINGSLVSLVDANTAPGIVDNRVELLPERNSGAVIANYHYSDADDDLQSGTIIAWYVADTQDGHYTRIEGANTDQLTVTAATRHKYVKAVVIPRDATGRFGAPVTSATVEAPAQAENRADASLAALSVEGFPLTPAFDPNVTNYTVNVPAAVDSVTVNAAATQAGARVDGTGEATLTGATATVNVYVFAPNNTTNKTYTITIHRAQSSNVTLENLTATAGSAEITYVKGTRYYALTAPDDATQLSFSLTLPQGATANARYNGEDQGNNSEWTANAFPLAAGLNSLELQVTAADGVSTALYRVVVLKNASSDASLSSLTVNGGDDLLPMTGNEAMVRLDGDTAAISAMANHYKATVHISVNGKPVASGQQVTLTKTVSTAAVRVVAEDGVTEQVYTITLIQKDDTSAELYKLDLGKVALATTFDANTENYTAVNYGNAATALNAIAAQAGAKITYETVDDYAVTEDASISKTLNFYKGAGLVDETDGKTYNTVIVTVTSPDGKHTKTYTVKVEIVEEVYLSDLDWVRAETQYSTIKKDEDIDGNPISLRVDEVKKEYEKGVCAHANATVVYDLSSMGFTVFSARAGISYYQSIAANNQPNLKFRVLLNDNEQADAEVNQAYMENAPEALTVSLNGAQKMTLSVTTNKSNNYGGHGIWADAKLSSPIPDIANQTNILIKYLELEHDSHTVYANTSHADHTVTLHPVVKPLGAALSGRQRVLIWNSDDTEIATVGQGELHEAIITGQSVGTTTVTVKNPSETLSATCDVTVKWALAGKVSVSGGPRVGSTLTGALNQLDQGAKGHVDIQWWRKGDGEAAFTEIPGATEKDYTVAADADNVGAQYKVAVTGKDLYEGTSESDPVTMTKLDGLPLKADPTAANATTADATDGAITGLFKGRAYQYQKVAELGGTPAAPTEAAWKDFCDDSDDETGSDSNYGTAVISGLATGTYVVRRAADGLHEAGPHRTVTIDVVGSQNFHVTNPNDFDGNIVQVGRTSIPEGDTVTLTVIPKEGHELVPDSLKATEDETGLAHVAQPKEGTANQYTFTMPAADVTISAQFQLKTYTIGHELTHITCSLGDAENHTATHGEHFSITLTPDEGYEMKPNAITVTNVDTDQPFTDYTYLPDETDSAKRVLTFAHGVTCNIAITGVAVRKTYPVDYSGLVSGLRAPNAPQNATHGEAFTITLVAAQGYALPESVTVTVGGVGAEAEYEQASGRITVAGEHVTGPVAIAAAGVAQDVALQTVTLVGPARVGRVLTVNTVPVNAKVDYQWYYVEDGAATPIPGAVNARYNITAADEGKSICVKVTGKDGYAGELTSDPTAAILPEAEPFVFVETVTLDETASVAAGKTVRLTATVTPEEPTSGTLFWSSDNEAVATVDQDGVVRGVAEGVVTITAAATDRLDAAYDTCFVTVTAAVSPSRPSGGNGSTTTKTETREDGSKVTTVTKPDGTVTETVEQPDGSKSEAVTAKDGNVTITVTDAQGEELAKVELPATIPVTEDRFDDVPEGHWADKAIHNAAALGLVKGVGGTGVRLYHMNDPMTRGSLATVLHRLSQGKTDYETTFQDVAQGKFYTEGVAWAAKVKVVTGYTEDIFAPEDVITREQLAVMLARYAKLIGLDTKADGKALDQFADGENTGSWAVDGVAWCVENGILQGKGGNVLDPTTNVTRAEVAVMLDRFIALLK